MSRDVNAEFNELIKTQVSTPLKLLGFKKQRLNYLRHRELMAQTCQVQKSQYQRLNSVRVTINFGFFIPVVSEALRKSKALPLFPKTDDCFIGGRTGHLIYGIDYWYDLHEDIAFETSDNQLKNDMANHILPMFQELQTIDNLLPLLRQKYEVRKYRMLAMIDAVAILELEYGQFERGKEILISAYQEAKTPKSIERITINPDGSEKTSFTEMQGKSYLVEHYEQLAKRYSISL